MLDGRPALALVLATALLSCASTAAAPDGGDDGDAGPSAGGLRVVSLGPDLGAVDVCLRPAGSDGWTGPILRAAGAPPVAYGEGSRPVPAPSGTVTARVVPAGADCDGLLTDDARNLVLDPSTPGATLLLAGLLAPAAGEAPFVMRALAEGSAAPAGEGRWAYRFVPAAAARSALDLGRVDAVAGFQTLLEAIPFATAATGTVARAEDRPWAVRAHAGADVLAAWTLKAPLDASQLGLYVGEDQGAFTLLVCDDGSPLACSRGDGLSGSRNDP